MGIVSIDFEQFRIFFLVLVRCSVTLAVLPFFGSRNLPTAAKVTFALALAFCIYPAAKASNWPTPVNVTDYLLIAVLELMMALSLALMIHLVLGGIQMAGQLVGFQMGTAMANVVDPQSGTQQSIVAQMVYLTAVLLFLSYNGHHVFIRALAQSIELVKPGAVNMTPGLFEMIIKLASNLFVLAIKILAPCVAALLFTQTAMGIVAKAVPQMNVLLVSFPLTISVGLFFLGISLSLLSGFMNNYITQDMSPMVGEAIRQMGGGQ